MSKRDQIGLLVLVAGAAASLAGSATAQDSVGRNASGGGALVKDNLGAYDTAQYLKSYVVDTVPVTSSWGNVFNVAPIIKSSNGTNTGVLTSAFLNTNTLSSLPIVARGSNVTYSFWQGGVGDAFGVNTGALPGGPVNDAPNRSELSLPPQTIQLGTAFIEGNSTAATGNTRYNGMVGGFINYDPANPTRLFVRRIFGASNNPAAIQSTTTVFGLGSADSNGNVHMRIDGFGADAANPNTLLPVSGQTNNNYLRINLGLRTGILNWIRAIQLPVGTVDPTFELGSDAVASEDVARGPRDASGIANPPLINLNVPNGVPASVAGRPLLLGSAFDRLSRYESAPAVLTATDTHRGPTTTDHRGTVSYTFRNVFPGSVNGTSAILAFQVNGIGRSGGDAISIATWGLASDGAPLGRYIFSLPDASLNLGMTDPYGINPNTGNPFDTATDFPLPPAATNPAFMDYQGNTFSTGGTGQPGVFVGSDGELVVAGLVTANSVPGGDPVRTDRRNYIAVGRANPNSPTPVTEWTCAAWVTAGLPDTTNDSTGKAIVDASGNVVGRITTYSDYNNIAVTSSQQGGPSLSPPTFDSAGNLYFIAPARLTDALGNVTKRLCLIRGVRQSNPFGYKLELLLNEGQVFRGANSGTNYRISGLKLGSTSTTNPVDNGTIFSSVATQMPFGNIDRTTLAQADSQTLGGIVIGASITYDVNDNGSFADSTVDQNYQALLFVHGGRVTTPPCPRDFNGDGFVDPDDLSDYISCFFNVPPCPRADLNGDGNTDPDDLSDYIALFFGGCP